MRKLAILILLMAFIHPLKAAVYYVRTDGKDTNTGKTDSPEGAWKSVKTAASRVKGGDQVVVADGTYYEGEIIFRAETNTKATPILLQSASRHGAKIVSTSLYHAFNLGNSVNVTIDGFDITFQEKTTSEYHGINVGGNWNVIRNCKIHGAPFSGIQGYLCDNLLIENNILYDNCKGTGIKVHENGSGISIYHPISRQAGEGFHIIIRNNFIYNNVALNNVGSTGFPTDGNGIIMDDFHCGQDWDKDLTKLVNYPYASLVENNLIVNNGGRGVHVFSSDQVTMRNNTCYHNGWKLDDYTMDPGDLTVESGKNNVIVNNIAVSRPDLKRGGAIRIALDNSTTQVKNNLVAGPKLLSSWSTSVKLDNTNKTSGNALFPAFVNPTYDLTSANFHLKATSPAIGAGTSSNSAETDIDGLARPLGSGIEMGCYEYDSTAVYTSLVIPPLDQTGFVVFPNPVTDQCSFQINSPKPAVVWLSILDLTGRVVGQKKYASQQGLNTFTYDTKGLLNGVYVMYLHCNQQTISRKLVIQH